MRIGDNQMTYALKFMAQAGKGEFKSLKIHPTVDGMMAQFVDMSDGQVYKVDVTPMGYSLSTDAIKAIKNGTSLKCETCGETLEDYEIANYRNACEMCHLEMQKPINKKAYYESNENDED